MVGGPLLLPIITAYIPQTGAAAFMADQIKGLPDWVMRDAYDIDAKVSDEDHGGVAEACLAEDDAAGDDAVAAGGPIQAGGPSGNQGLSGVLADRGKGGPKFKETDPTAEHPDGIKLPWGGVVVQSRRRRDAV